MQPRKGLAFLVNFNYVLFQVPQLALHIGMSDLGEATLISGVRCGGSDRRALGKTMLTKQRAEGSVFSSPGYA